MVRIRNVVASILVYLSSLISLIFRQKLRQVMGNVIFSVLWLLILIFVGFWVAGVAAGFYILLIPFSVCVEPLTGLTDFLLLVVQFPKYCAQAMVDGKGFN